MAIVGIINPTMIHEPCATKPGQEGRRVQEMRENEGSTKLRFLRSCVKDNLNKVRLINTKQ